MFTAIMITGVAGMVLAVAAVVAMSVAVRAEDRRLSHAGPAPTRLAGLTRRVTGLHVS